MLPMQLLLLLLVPGLSQLLLYRVVPLQPLLLLLD
jgi:hypothetical protein